jgi:uncharacterized membrane protein YhhN
MQLEPALTALILTSAILAIVGELTGRRRLVYAAKPLTMMLILGLAMGSGARGWDLYKFTILAGLCASLVGDVFLMFPGDRFLPGLVSFLLAHICYIVAFATPHALNDGLWVLALMVGYGCAMYGFLFPQLGALKLPVAIYVAVILAMGWLAVARFVAEHSSASFDAAVGALLFIASDSLLAIDRFRKPLRWAGLWILGTYFVAQILIAKSVGG